MNETQPTLCTWSHGVVVVFRSVGIYLDTVNIFIRVAMLLAGGGGRRKWTGGKQQWYDKAVELRNVTVCTKVQKSPWDFTRMYNARYFLSNCPDLARCFLFVVFFNKVEVWGKCRNKLACSTRAFFVFCLLHLLECSGFVDSTEFYWCWSCPSHIAFKLWCCTQIYEEIKSKETKSWRVFAYWTLNLCILNIEHFFERKVMAFWQKSQARRRNLALSGFCLDNSMCFFWFGLPVYRACQGKSVFSFSSSFEKKRGAGESFNAHFFLPLSLQRKTTSISSPTDRSLLWIAEQYRWTVPWRVFLVFCPFIAWDSLVLWRFELHCWNLFCSLFAASQKRVVYSTSRDTKAETDVGFKCQAIYMYSIVKCQWEAGLKICG